MADIPTAEGQNQIVYQHIRNDSGVVFYVGIGLRRRANSKRSRTMHWQSIVKEHGYKVDVLYENISMDEACSIEKELIKSIGKACDGGTLINITDGGNCGSLGWKAPDETRKKMGDSHRGEKGFWFGKKHNEETKKKFSEAKRGNRHHNYGKHLSEETRKNISLGNKGKKRTDELKALLSAIVTGRKASDETKLKMSKSGKGKHSLHNLGKKHTEETTKKRLLTRKLNGKKLSDESREKYRQSKIGNKNPQFGKPLSEETKAKMKATVNAKKLLLNA